MGSMPFDDDFRKKLKEEQEKAEKEKQERGEEREREREEESDASESEDGAFIDDTTATRIPSPPRMVDDDDFRGSGN